MVIRVLPPIHISPEKLKLKNDIKKDLNKLKIKNSKNVKNNKRLSIHSIHDMHISKSLQDFEKSLMKLKGDNKDEDGDTDNSDRVVEIYDDDEGINICVYVCVYISLYMYLNMYFCILSLSLPPQHYHPH
jgi:hypothetical protein